MGKRDPGLEEGIRSMMHELEAVAKSVRATVRRRAKEVGLTRKLDRAAKQLREGAAKAALQVEKYAHSVRVELEANGRPKRTRAGKR